MNSQFGQYIRRKRREVGWSLRQLADALGCSHVYLGEVERGVRAPFGEKWWPRLAETLPRRNYR